MVTKSSKSLSSLVKAATAKYGSSAVSSKLSKASKSGSFSGSISGGNLSYIKGGQTTTGINTSSKGLISPSFSNKTTTSTKTPTYQSQKPMYQSQQTTPTKGFMGAFDFGDVSGQRGEKYKGQGVVLSSGDIVTDFTKGRMEVPKELNVYGETAKQAERANQGTLANRNDYIAYNLKSQGVSDRQGIAEFLTKQEGYLNSTPEDQRNTVEAVAARMGIDEAQPKEDLLLKQQDDLFLAYKTEKDKLALEGNKNDFVKKMDNLLGEQIRELTPYEIVKLSKEAGITPEEGAKVAEQWAKERAEFSRPFQEKEFDLTKDKTRAVEDAQKQLERTKWNMNNQIDDIDTQMQRDLAAADKIGALKGYNLSSGYQQGINNVRNDAVKLIDRLNTQIGFAETDTAQYIGRVGEDFTTNMDRVKNNFTDSLLDLRLAGTAEVNHLLTKYSRSDELMTSELERINREYGLKSMDLYGKFLENFKGITDASMYEAEKVQQFQTKQKELENMTLSYLYQNGGMALRNMSDSAIENLYKEGYITSATIDTLKSARDSAQQNFGLEQQNIAFGQEMDMAKLGMQQQQTAYDMGLLTPQGTVPKTRSESISALQNIIQQNMQSPNDFQGAASALSTSVNDGTSGGQCGYFANNYAQALGMKKLFGDTLKSKTDQINNDKTPVIGGFVVMDSQNTPGSGHVGIVTNINPNGTITVKSSNYNGDEKVRTDTISLNSPSIKGFVDLNKKVNPMQGKEDKGPTFDIEKLSGGAQNIIAGGMKISQIPSDQRVKVATEVRKYFESNKDAYADETEYNIRKSAIYEKLPDGTVQKKLSAIKNTQFQIDNLEKELQNKNTGPLRDIWEKSSDKRTNQDTQKLRAQLQAIIPGLARGVFGEVGVLTDADIENYRKTIPNIGNKEEVNKAIAQNIKDILRNSFISEMNTQANSQVDVSGFADDYLFWKGYGDKTQTSQSGIDRSGLNSLDF